MEGGGSTDKVPLGMDVGELWDFLRGCIRAFHYAPSDIEWAWDGEQFWLLQIRPVTAYQWRRSLSSANLDEILPAQVSRIMEHAQRRASLSIGRLYGLWDRRNLQDNEPFTVVSEDASYLNLDLYMARFKDWGLPAELIAREIGGAAPGLDAHKGRFLLSLRVFWRMQRRVRREILRTEEGLRGFDVELMDLEARDERLGASEGRLERRGGEQAPSGGMGTEDGLKEDVGKADAEHEAALVNWFVRYYVFIVRQNMVINACLSAAMGSFWGRARTVYRQMADAPHRLKFESDPASPRSEGEAPPLAAFPRWPWWVEVLHRLGAPGLGGKYFEVREWFRDNNMRLFFRLHRALEGSDWLLPHPGVRTRHGTFWQDGSGLLEQVHGFVIHPGAAEGVVGEDILIVDALEPGHYEDYKRAKAVIARTGGRLSHGATLLRELKKPSAVLPGVRLAAGTRVRYVDGVIEEVRDER